jgi:hypothetical protein
MSRDSPGSTIPIALTAAIPEPAAVAARRRDLYQSCRAAHSCRSTRSLTGPVAVDFRMNFLIDDVLQAGAAAQLRANAPPGDGEFLGRAAEATRWTIRAKAIDAGLDGLARHPALPGAEGVVRPRKGSQKLAGVSSEATPPDNESRVGFRPRRGRTAGVQASACGVERGSQNFTRRARSLKAELQLCHPSGGLCLKIPHSWAARF